MPVCRNAIACRPPAGFAPARVDTRIGFGGLCKEWMGAA